MSRVGKKPIPIPEKVDISCSGQTVTVKGAKGTLTRTLHPAMKLEVEGGSLHVVMAEDNRTNQALQGLTRSLVANMVHGTHQGFERVLEINGIGYRAEVKGNSIVLNLGFSHPIDFELPAGVSATVDRNTIIKLSSIDKELLGQAAASIRRLRPPEPYKGKGIKFAEEFIQRKAGKTGTK